MNKGVWLIILIIILAAIVAVVVGAYYLNFSPGPADLPIDRQQVSTDQPTEVKFTDEQIVRLELKLKDSDPNTRFVAICSLNTAAQNNPEGIGPILVRALANEDPKVRYLAVNQLGEIKYVPAAKELTTLLDDDDKDVTTGAAQALVKLGEKGLQAVMESLSEKRLKNVDKALIVVKQITGRSFGQGQKGREEALKFWAEYRLQR
ncbi:MAG: hypothetical protein GWP14_01840 [Actinobacteria bacterium]|nr:hypothetical protein [Actinomycetota bacterium]